MATRSDSSTSGFGFLSFIWRFIAALALVLATFNPSGYSAYHWISEAIRESAFGPLHLLLIAVLIAGWVVFWIATWRSLDTLGVTLAAVIIGAIVWLLVDIGWLHPDSRQSITWIVLVCLALILALGLSWSHISRRITGQVNVEDIDN
jgi:hypothetical protein